jgi:hypothetical protein
MEKSSNQNAKPSAWPVVTRKSRRGTLHFEAVNTFPAVQPASAFNLTADEITLLEKSLEGPLPQAQMDASVLAPSACCRWRFGGLKPLQGWFTMSISRSKGLTSKWNIYRTNRIECQELFSLNRK